MKADDYGEENKNEEMLDEIKQKDFYINYLRSQINTLIREHRCELNEHERAAQELLCGSKKGEDTDILPQWLKALNNTKTIENNNKSRFTLGIAWPSPDKKIVNNVENYRNVAQFKTPQKTTLETNTINMKRKNKYIVLTKERINRLSKISLNSSQN